MYVIIIGCGNVGYHLATSLLSMGHEVLGIEKNIDLCQRITDELGSVIFHGNGSQVRVLKEAGAKRADLLIAATGNDEDNLVACQVAKKQFGTPRTVALVNHPENEPLFKLLGVDATINTVHMIASKVEESIPEHPLVHRPRLRNPNVEMVSIFIPPDAAVVAKPLEQFQLPPNSFICLVVKVEGPRLPSEELVLEAEDEVVAITVSEEEQTLYEVLTEVE